MKKNSQKNANMVTGYIIDNSLHIPKAEKIWFVGLATVRRHSRVLYLPLDPTMVRIFKLKKGDVIKFETLELRRSPAEKESIEKEEGELND
jgi:hypothetical protein